MKILFASAEVAPFSKVGGLADVVGSLPKALEKKAEICIFTPLYGSIDQEKFRIKELENSSLKIAMGNSEHIFKLKIGKLPGTKINVFFVDNPKYYSCFNCVYPQWVDTMYEQQRYVAFSLAVLEYAKLLNFRPDVIHANDWHTAMIPVYIKNNYKYDDFYKDTKTVFSIHNLAYQGSCDSKIIDFANMRWDNVYNDRCLEHYGRVNWVKGAIYCSDKIIAVSEKYAQEIMGEEFGEGMDYTLRDNAWKVMGITNGIDYTEFNPKTDKNLIKNYDLMDMTGKEACKKEIVEKFGMPYCPNTPLIGMVSRLVYQKGIDLIRDMQWELQKVNAQYIILGTGEYGYENLMIWLSNNSWNIRAMVDYKSDWANKIYGGSDFFLMPSKFEPCGLSQLIAMRYGCLPIARATGGLEDTIVGYPLNGSTGFKFYGYNGWDMLEAIKRAEKVFQDKYTFNAMRKSAMQADFTWDKSASKYMEVYREICSK